MAEVIRELGPEDVGAYMPTRELLEPGQAEAAVALANYVVGLMAQGLVEQNGLVLIELNDGTQAADSYSIDLS